MRDADFLTVASGSTSHNHDWTAFLVFGLFLSSIDSYFLTWNFNPHGLTSHQTVSFIILVLHINKLNRITHIYSRCVYTHTHTWTHTCMSQNLKSKSNLCVEFTIYISKCKHSSAKISLELTWTCIRKELSEVMCSIPNSVNRANSLRMPY